jgi:uncharacterized protein YjdB
MEVYCVVQKAGKINEPTKKITLNEPLAYNNALAHAMRYIAFDKNNAPIDLQEENVSVTASFVKSNNVTVEPILGTVDGNVAEVILPPSCYVTPGRFRFTMNLNKGEAMRTVLWVEGNVERNTTDEIVDPGTPVGNIEQAIGQATAAAAAASEAADDANEAAQDIEDFVSDIVMIQSAQPTSELNRFWIPTEQQLEVEVPTYEEFEELSDNVDDLKSAMGDLTDLTTEDKSTLVAAINEAAISGGGGLTDAVKSALLHIFTKVAYVDEHGQNYYNDLYDALYSVTAVLLNSHSIMLNTLGATYQLTARTIPEGGQITWTSSNPAVATVDQTGLVTSVAYGNATITATSGSVSDMCGVTISQVTCESIEAVYTPSGIVYNTDSLDSLKGDLEVTATWSDGSTMMVPGEDYTLSGTLAIGQSVITISYGGQTATFEVAVVGVTSITATYTQSGIVRPTDSLDDLRSDLTVFANLNDGRRVTVSDYALTGTLVTGVSSITVVYNEKTTSFSVNVTPVYSYSLANNDLILFNGGITWNDSSAKTAFITTVGENPKGRRAVLLDKGDVPLKYTTNEKDFTDSEYYPIAIPPDAVGVTISITPNERYVGVIFYTLSNGLYRKEYDPGWVKGGASYAFAAGQYTHLTATSKYSSASFAEYAENPTDFTIVFERGESA